MQIQMQKTHKLKAETKKPVEIELRGEATLEAAKGDGKGPRRFSMVAYDGGPMRPKVDPPLPHPVVVDLAGLDVSKQRYPALKDHDSKSLVGHTDKVTADKKLTAEGVISGTGAAATEVVASADNGFTWGVSMGAVFPKMELIAAGKSANVNGRSHAGPIYIARNGRLRELSFLTLAADDDTAATIAAEAAESGEVMDFKTWLKANGFQPEDKLSASRLIVLRAQFKACGGIKLEDAAKTSLQATLDAIEEPSTVKANEGNDTLDADSGNSDLRAQIDDMRREQTVYRLCADHREIAEKAIKAKWNDDTIKMAIETAELRASLPKGIQIKTGQAKDAPAEGVVLEAACALAGGLHEVEKKFDQKALNEAGSRFRHGISLQELLLQAAWANGYTGNSVRQDVRGVLEAAFTVRAAQFSTISLPGIFANTANKFLLEAFMFVEQVWRNLVAGVRPVNDFKTITSYRLTDGGEFEEVGPGGEIAHGKLGEESFTNKAKSWGKMFGISFQDIRNDDLGALTSVPRKLGRGSGLKLNRVFWAAFLDNSSFFADPSQDYLKGATTNLSSAGLTAALLKFRSKVEDTTADPTVPLAIDPKILLVPPALEVTAAVLMAAALFNSGGASTDPNIPNKNPWAGRFTAMTSQYMLSETATTYYLLADPRDVPVMEVVALDGKIEPTVETADADFNTLGVLMRGTSHWGVAKQDARGGLKVKGAA